MPPAIAITLWTICMSMSAVVAPGFDCDPPSSAASRAPWRTADPEVTLSETMMLASKPPMSSKASSGTTSASSTRDWPRVFPMSVALRLQPDVVADAAADVFANYPDRLVIGRGRVAELRGHPGALDGCVAGGSDAEHQEAAVQHAQHEHEQDG